MRAAFSRIGSKIWCDAHSVGILLVGAALIGRRVFLFTAAVCAAAYFLSRSRARDKSGEPALELDMISSLPVMGRAVNFRPPPGAVLPSVPDLARLREALEGVIVGQTCVIEAIMLGLLADGHVLLEGAPGLGKTLACMTMSRATDSTFARIQCNADLTPADIVGCEIFDQRDLSFKIRLGPVFANIVLVDEINRAPARAQAALLEAMEDRSVTIASENYALPDPFFLLATMNEAEADGVFPLPAAQLDRFLLKVVLEFPTETEDLAILESRAHAIQRISAPRASIDEVREWQSAARATYCAPELKQYIVDLVRETRKAAELGELKTGAGPRAGLAMLRTAGARAILAGRAHVLPDDVKSIALAGLRHRILFKEEYRLTREEREERLRAIVDCVPAP